MDVNGGGVGDGIGDPSDQFHRNEAISAVADDGFLGEEEEDDYEDLYNDVNVGENFLQSLRKTEDPPAVEKKGELDPQPQALPPPPQVVEERKPERQEGEEGVGSRALGSGMGYKGPDAPSAGSGPPVGGGGGFRVELAKSPPRKVGDLDEKNVGSGGPNPLPHHHATASGIAPVGNGAMMPQGGGNVNVNGNFGPGGAGIGQGVGGSGGGSWGNGTILFVGDLHWWTTDAELEAELIKYGPVKEVKFFDEKASGKSKGYCQVEFYDPSHATACKEGMNGHMFNGRPCVVAFASPLTVKKMGEAQVNRNQQMSQSNVNQGRRGPADVPGKTGGNNIAAGGNYQGGPDNNRGYGRGNWGRGGGQGMGNRGPAPIRNRGGGMAGRGGMMGNGGNGFGQGIGGTPPMMHPQAMMSQGFDPAFGGPLGRMGGYGGFPAGPTPPFSGLLSSFPPVGSVGLHGVAPHVNPAFFNRGMPMNGMGMMPTSVEGPNMGMWSDPNMGGWPGDEHGGRAAESSYGEEAASEHQYGESHDRGAWQGGTKDKDRGSEREWSGSSDRRHRDDRDTGYDRDIPKEKNPGYDDDWSERRHRDERDVGRDREMERGRDRARSRDHEHRDRERPRDERDRYSDHHRYREREAEYDDEWDRGRSSRTHSKSRSSHDERRSRSRDADYGKRRRLTSD